MKKIILTVVAISVFGFVNAQNKKESNLGFVKGDVFVSGALKFGSDSKVSYYKQDSFVFAPSVGYFVTDNIALGVNLNVGFGSVQATSTSGKSKTNSIGAGLAGRYYFMPGSQFTLFAELGTAFGMVKSTPVLGTVTKVNSLGIALTPGLDYFVSKNFCLETKIALLSYVSSKGDWTGSEKTSSIRFGADWSAFTFGANYKF
jgi:outer membrane protein W